jgi:FkbM family methyltransferase
MHEINIFLEYLRRSSACIDIGANVGLYSCLAVSQGKPVIAIEPNFANLQRLYRNLAANEFFNIELYPVGLSSTPGIRRLYGSGLNASLVAGWARAAQNRYSLVPLTTLDILLGARFEGVPITIKMDVEGHEFEVLQGARRTLALEPKPFWLIEIVLTEQVPGGINSRIYDTFEMFWDCGYQAHTADQDRRLVRPQDVKRWIATGRRDFGSYNYCFSNS